jgi:hypothetical protein
MEEWKIHPTYPNYKISNFGNVQSWNYISKKWKPKVLKKINKGNGDFRYVGFTIGLGERHKTKTLLVHQVVAELFIGPRPPGMIVMHKDHDTHNNLDSNLMYGTASQNVKQSVRDGRIRYKRDSAGRFAGSEKR